MEQINPVATLALHLDWYLLQLTNGDFDTLVWEQTDGARGSTNHEDELFDQAIEQLRDHLAKLY